MIAALLLLASVAGAAPACERTRALRSPDMATAGVGHAFQNGEGVPLRLAWIDPAGRPVDIATIAPGAFHAVQTFVGHVFVLTDPQGRCRRTVRIDDATHGTYVGTSRYRTVAVRAGWHVLVDRALDPAAEPARTALATVAAMLARAEAALPPASLAEVRRTSIFLHDHAGPGGMFHPDPGWLVAHGRTVEMVEGIELSDAGMFVETAKLQPGSVLHELAHAHYIRLPGDDRAAIEAAYRQAMDRGLYRKVQRPDGST